MIPEPPLRKLSWVLGHTRERAGVMRMMTTPVAHEITPREPHNGSLVMPGGPPETEEWGRGQWK